MEDEGVPSISMGQVGSRFISQDDIETAKAKRDEQWRAAYARLGQEPPTQQVEDFRDGRSLAEKLAANRAAKQEEWEEKTKLGNQFRALEEDEALFLGSVRDKQLEIEREIKEKDGKEIKNFKEAVAARNVASNPAPIVKDAPPPPPKPAAPPKSTKRSLKGVIVKKKPKAPAPATATKAETVSGDEDERIAKRQKV